MARIRSIHPGIFTDEAFAALGSDAQVLYLGLLTEADDQGIFEWKPITLRMRLRPTKDGPIEALLSEIEAVNSIRKYELGGRHYGAIRNFRKYQRPKNPKSVHPITDEIRTYVALSGENSELDEDDEASIPTKGKISPQMEDGGGRMKGGGDKSSLRSETRVAFKPPDWIPPKAWAGFVEMRRKIKAPLTERAMSLAAKDLEKLKENGHDPGTVLDQSTKNSWKGLFPIKHDSLNNSHHSQNGAHVEIEYARDANEWRDRVRAGKKNGVWLAKWGPPMGSPGCLIPPEVVREFSQ